MHLTLSSLLTDLPLFGAERGFTGSKLAVALVVIGCLLWVVKYVLAIRIGFRDKTYAIPWAAVCFNISWELLFSFYYEVPPFPTWISRLWLALDAIILYQVVRYGPKEETNPVARRYFFHKLAIMLLSSLALEVTLIKALAETLHGGTTAFVINLVMAALFISLRWERPSRRGLTRWGAWAMTIGTALNAIGAVMLEDPAARATKLDLTDFLHVVYLLIFVFNCIYLYLLLKTWPAEAEASSA